MTEQLRAARKDFSRVGLALLTVAGVAVVLQLGFSMILEFLFPAEDLLTDHPLLLWLLTFAPMYLVAMPAGLLVFRRISAEPVAPQKMEWKHFGILMLICMPIMYAGNIIGTFLSLLLSGGTAENILMDYVFSSPLYTFLVAVLIAPFMEEYIFRKQIIDRCGKYGEVTAILVSALTFALFHMNLFQFFYAFGLGILMAYAYTRTRMLRYPVLMHMIINFMGSVLAPAVLNLLDMEALESLSAGQFDPEMLVSSLPGLLLYFGYAALLNVLYVAGFVFLIIRWKKRTILPTAQELPKGSHFKTVWLNVGMILYFLFTLAFTVFSLL